MEEWIRDFALVKRYFTDVDKDENGLMEEDEFEETKEGLESDIGLDEYKCEDLNAVTDSNLFSDDEKKAEAGKKTTVMIWKEKL